jgi:hypothetical protein
MSDPNPTQAASVRPQLSPDFWERLAARTGIKPGWPDDSLHASLPHRVQNLGLTREALGDEEFEKALGERTAWCRDRCPDRHAIAPIRDGHKLTGREFLFSDKSDAALFKLWFG